MNFTLFFLFSLPFFFYRNIHSLCCLCVHKILTHCKYLHMCGYRRILVSQGSKKNWWWRSFLVLINNKHFYKDTVKTKTKQTQTNFPGLVIYTVIYPRLLECSWHVGGQIAVKAVLLLLILPAISAIYPQIIYLMKINFTVQKHHQGSTADVSN